MGFWFIPRRVNPNSEELGGSGILWPEDIKLYEKYNLARWANGSWRSSARNKWGWGTKGDAYALGDLLGEQFNNYINKFAPPEIVRQWGLALQNIHGDLLSDQSKPEDLHYD